jgi:hypothetical protein
MKIPPQIIRIVLLAVGIVLTYSVARALLTPPSFKQYGGFYRGAALEELAAPEPVHAGRKECASCHVDEEKVMVKGAHKTLSCEGCHGAGQAHAENPDLKPTILNFSHCARCHEYNISRPKWHKQVITKEHYAGSKCTECHIPHNPTEVP